MSCDKIETYSERVMKIYRQELKLVRKYNELYKICFAKLRDNPNNILLIGIYDDLSNATLKFVSVDRYPLHNMERNNRQLEEVLERVEKALSNIK